MAGEHCCAATCVAYSDDRVRLYGFALGSGQSHPLTGCAEELRFPTHFDIRSLVGSKAERATSAPIHICLLDVLLPKLVT